MIILRLPLVYGLNPKGNFLILSRLIKYRFPLPFGLIEDNSRSFLFEENLISLTKKILFYKKKINDTFLVSDDHDVSLTELIHIMSNAMQK